MTRRLLVLLALAVTALALNCVWQRGDGALLDRLREVGEAVLRSGDSFDEQICEPDPFFKRFMDERLYVRRSRLSLARLAGCLQSKQQAVYFVVDFPCLSDNERAVSDVEASRTR